MNTRYTIDLFRIWMYNYIDEGQADDCPTNRNLYINSPGIRNIGEIYYEIQ